MRTSQMRWDGGEWRHAGAKPPVEDPQLVLAFAATADLDDARSIERARAIYPGALVMGCSTAGQILDTNVTDEGTLTAVRFDKTRVESAEVTIEGAGSSFDAGQRLAGMLPTAELAHVFVLADGQRVNGSELVRGMHSRLPDGVALTGGLAADGSRFERTLVFARSKPAPGRIVALGFYGQALDVGCASLGGWDSFGPERLVTRSAGNVVFELDGQPALELYRRYLGHHAADLPAAGLLFPLSVRQGDGEVVRTLLSVNEAEQSITFAGDVPQGAYARLMKANFDRLIEGAHGAAERSRPRTEPELVLLISCVGRRLVLKQRTEEEVEAVRDVFGPTPAMTGFYSYGEICPAAPDASCELHNQTMTITTLAER